MTVLLICRACNAQHPISGLNEHQDLADITGRLGWELTKSGWLCPQHRHEQSVGLLREEALQAGQRWMDAATAFDRSMSDLSNGLFSPPDGSAFIKKAGQARRTAFQKYREALAKYKDAVRESRAADEPHPGLDPSNESDAANGKLSSGTGPAKHE